MDMSGVNKTNLTRLDHKYTVQKIQYHSMTKYLYRDFSSVYTTMDINSLPIPDAKFQETKSDYEGQLNVPTEMVAKQIKANKWINEV